MAVSPTPPRLCAYLAERWGGTQADGRTASATYPGLPAVQAANDIRVSWGNPYPDKVPDVILIVDDIEDYSLEPTAGLTQWREKYRVSCYISVAKHPQTAKATTWGRAWDLWGDVLADITAMNSDGTLPAGVSIVMPADAHSQNAIATDVREDAIIFGVQVTGVLVDA